MQLIGRVTCLTVISLLAVAGAASDALAARVSGPYTGTRYQSPLVCNTYYNQLPSYCGYGDYPVQLIAPSDDPACQCSGYVSAGQCVTESCYYSSSYVVGPIKGDILFHTKNTDSGFENPVAKGQEVLFGPNTFTHVSTCWSNSTQGCVQLLHQNMDPALAVTKLIQGGGYGLSVVNKNLVSSGVPNLCNYTALEPGVGNYIPILTTHRGAIQYYRTNDATLKSNLQNTANWQMGTRKYNLGGGSAKLDRSGCSQALADSASLTGNEGHDTFYVTTQDLPTVINAAYNAMYDAIWGMPIVQSTYSALSDASHLSFWQSLGVAVISNRILDKVVEVINTTTIMGVTFNQLFTNLETSHFSGDMCDVAERIFDCGTWGWLGGCQEANSLECMAQKAKPLMLDIIADGVKTGMNLQNNDCANGENYPRVKASYEYTKFSAPEDMYQRLARDVSGAPCNPAHKWCSAAYRSYDGVSAGSCQPRTCASAGATCGTILDGCGFGPAHTLTCGSTCSSSGGGGSGS